MNKLISRRTFLAVAWQTSAAWLLRRWLKLRPTTASNHFVLTLWSGAITPDSGRVNARIDHDSATVRLIVSQQPDFSQPRYSAYQSANLNENNRMVSLAIDGLQADTRYYYAIEADGLPDTINTGEFHTPAAGPFSFTVAFSACAITASSHPVFNTIRQYQPLFFLHTGDLHYADIDSNDRHRYRQAFDAVLAAPAQAALYRVVPIAYMWDDHDYGPNDSDATAPGRLAARLTYQEYVPHYPLVAGSGDVPIYQAFTIGRVRFILTDTRSERTPKIAPDNAAKTMMGAAQKTWFKQELLNANGVYPVIIWVSTSPWLADPPGSGDDNWAGYTTERQELADFIANHGIHSLFMLSGDVHMVAIDDGRNNLYGSNGLRGFPIMQAAALDRPNSSWLPDNDYSDGQFPGSGQFGLMTIMDDGGPLVRLTWSGRNHLDHELTHLEMTAPPSPRLGIAPAVLQFLAGSGPTLLSHTLTVFNWNVGEINWDITVENPPPWLSFTPTSGTVTADAPDTVRVTVDASGLTPGVYQAALQVTGDQGTGSPQWVTVTLLLAAAAAYLPLAAAAP